VEIRVFLRLALGAHLLLLLLLVRSPALSAGVLVVYAAFHALVAWGVLHPRSRLFGPNLSRLATGERVAALTFDDGPHPDITPRVLDMLRARGVQATFFLIGRAVRTHPDIVRRIVAEGHAIGNHSDEHSYSFWAFLPARLRQDIGSAQRAIEASSCAPCRWFRAPVGLKNCFLHPVLKRHGLELVSWRIRFLDRPHLDPQRVAARLRRRLRPGSILMLHDGHDRRPQGRPETLVVLPLVLDVLDEAGYRCVKLR